MRRQWESVRGVALSARIVVLIVLLLMADAALWGRTVGLASMGWVVGLTATAVWAVALPSSVAPGIVLALLMVCWCLEAHAVWATLLFVGGLALVHQVLAWLAITPLTSVVPRTSLAALGRRLALAVGASTAAAAVLAGFMWALRIVGLGGQIWAAEAIVLTVAALIWMALRTRTED